jgi:hypothetical protein
MPLPGVLAGRHMPVAVGVGHDAPSVSDEVQPIPKVRRADSLSREYSRPRGVAGTLKITLYKVEPAVANRSLNLLAEENRRAALRDEAKESRPQTGRSSGHPARRSAWDQPPMPAKKWHCANPRRSAGDTSWIGRSSTSPFAMRPSAMISLSHAAVGPWCSL